MFRCLRSPASAHPDMFSVHGLGEFAREHGREDELSDVATIYAKELGGINARLRDLDEGLFDVPTQALFIDFCRSLAAKLPHRCVQGHVVCIDRAVNGRGDHEEGGGDETPASSRPAANRQHLHVQLCQQDGSRGFVSARNVVLAVGAAGPSLVPPAICNGLPPQFVTHTNAVTELMALKNAAPHGSERVLVVGGGLSAIQAAIAFASRGSRVVLASRRPLSWRHFDLPIPWLDRRTLNSKRHDFFSTKLEERAAFIKEARGSGTVPPWYRNKLKRSGVECVVAKVAEAVHHEPACCGGPGTGAATPALQGAAGAPVRVALEAPDGSTRELRVNRVVLGTGSVTDCLELPLLKALHARWPVGVVGGLPVINLDLSWAPGLPVYVVGGLAALRVGPDAANLMGARRAAELVAQSLGVYDQLEDAGSYVVANKYSMFLDSSDDDSSTEEENEEKGRAAPTPCS